MGKVLIDSWEIDKKIDGISYGHRVWTQQLESEFCAVGDTGCKCKHLHGHNANIHVFMRANHLENGFVTDFKHVGWIKDFLNDHIDHKFILDWNDPWCDSIINGSLRFKGKKDEKYPTRLKLTNPIQTDQQYLDVNPVYVPGTDLVAGYELDVSELIDGPEREFFESFFIVDFVPTSESLSKWLWYVANKKMHKLGVHVYRVDWFETEKSRASYRRVWTSAKLAAERYFYEEKKRPKE